MSTRENRAIILLCTKDKMLFGFTRPPYPLFLPLRPPYPLSLPFRLPSTPALPSTLITDLFSLTQILTGPRPPTPFRDPSALPDLTSKDPRSPLLTLTSSPHREPSLPLTHSSFTLPFQIKRTSSLTSSFLSNTLHLTPHSRSLPHPSFCPSYPFLSLLLTYGTYTSPIIRNPLFTPLFSLLNHPELSLSFSPTLLSYLTAPPSLSPPFPLLTISPSPLFRPHSLLSTAHT